MNKPKVFDYQSDPLFNASNLVKDNISKLSDGELLQLLSSLKIVLQELKKRDIQIIQPMRLN